MSLTPSNTNHQNNTHEVIIQHHNGGGTYQLPSASVATRFFEPSQLTTTVVATGNSQTLLSLSPGHGQGQNDDQTNSGLTHHQHHHQQQQHNQQQQHHQQQHHQHQQLIEAANATVNLSSLGTPTLHQVQNSNGTTSFVYEYYKMSDKDAAVAEAELQWR